MKQFMENSRAYLDLYARDPLDPVLQNPPTYEHDESNANTWMSRETWSRLYDAWAGAIRLKHSGLPPSEKSSKKAKRAAAPTPHAPSEIRDMLREARGLIESIRQRRRFADFAETKEATAPPRERYTDVAEWLGDVRRWHETESRRMDEYQQRESARGELGQLLESTRDAGGGELPGVETQRATTVEEWEDAIGAFRGDRGSAPSSPSTAAPSSPTDDASEGHSETDYEPSHDGSPSTELIDQKSWISRRQDSAAYRYLSLVDPRSPALELPRPTSDRGEWEASVRKCSDRLRKTYASVMLDAAAASLGGVVKERVEALVLQILVGCLARETRRLNLVVVDGQSVLNSSRIVSAVDILSTFSAANPEAFVVVFHRDKIGGGRGGSSREDVVAHDHIGAIVFARARFTTRQKRLEDHTTVCASNVDEHYDHQKCRCDDLMMHWFLVLAVQYGEGRRVTAVSNNSCYNTRSHNFYEKWAPEGMWTIPNFSVSICANGKPFRDEAIKQTPFQWMFQGDELAPLQAAVRFSRADKTYDVGVNAHCVDIAMHAIRIMPVPPDSWMYLSAEEVKKSNHAVR